MSLADKIYRKLLWLYPAEHQREYSRLMTQHAHDLNRAAQGRGRLQFVGLYIRLVKDVLANALIEHGEAIMTAKGSFQPVPWLSVLLVAIPGLLIALTRRNVEPMGPLLSAISVGYILLLAIGLPVIWWRKGRFPVWGLLFAGALSWHLAFRAGIALNETAGISGIFGYGRGLILLNITLAMILLLVLTRGRRVPKAVWVMLGIIVLYNILTATIYSFARSGGLFQASDLQQFINIASFEPAEGLLLLAVGLLAARQHGNLAILVVVGGYAYLFLDRDILSGYTMRDWSGLPPYLFSVSFVFLVVTPVALLRARTILGRTISVFVPAVLFLGARLLVPLLVIDQPIRMMPGDASHSINILLILILAWILYSSYDASVEPEQSSGLEEGLPRPAAAK